MSDFQALQTLLAAGELAAISSLILCAAWLYTRGKSAGRRHLIWASAFGALLLVPVIVAFVPGSIVWTLTSPHPVMVQDVSLDFDAATPRAVSAPEIHFDIPSIAQAVVLLWAAGVLAIALRALLSAFLLRRLKRDSIENPFEASELPLFARTSQVELRVSNGEHGPIAWGIFRPVILLPQRALYWSGERLEAVLLHELAHVRRRDSLAQMLSLAACAVYWPNPLVWLAAARMRHDAEMATDDAVLRAGIRASDYAGELLQIAAELRARPLSAFAPMHMASPSALETRVKAVLAPTNRRSGVTTMDVLKTMAVALLATSALVIARPSLAQDSATAAVTAAPLPPPAPPAPGSVPPPPPAPMAAEAPLPPPAGAASPVPPAPAADAVPPVPAAPAAAQAVISSDGTAYAYTAPDGKPMNIQVRSITHRVHGRNVTHTSIIVNGKPIDVNAAVARVAPDIKRAVAQMEANQTTLAAEMAAHRQAMAAADEAMKAVGPEMEAALARAQAELAKANLDIRVRQRVDDAMKRVQIRIETRGLHPETPQPAPEGKPDGN